MLQSPAPTALTYRYEALHVLAHCHRALLLPRRQQAAIDSGPMLGVGDARAVFEIRYNDPRSLFLRRPFSRPVLLSDHQS
jgi:hypothetical protein